MWACRVVGCGNIGSQRCIAMCIVHLTERDQAHRGFLAVDSLVYVGVSHARTVLRTKSCAVRLRPYCCTVRYYAASFCIGETLDGG